MSIRYKSDYKQAKAQATRAKRRSFVVYKTLPCANKYTQHRWGDPFFESTDGIKYRVRVCKKCGARVWIETDGEVECHEGTRVWRT